ncbi:alpha/beta hydrolase family protein [Maribacter sp. 2307ULW6-5]|uniref:alpha/beta hydrolase family protein n=1 Tax=Maribacter sp. 2307ULW6-5 TaxID=3386275 RepID=UPI0039BCD8A4
MHKYLFVVFSVCTFMAQGQKKILDHDDYALWSTVEGEAISPNGEYILYSLEKGEKDHSLKIHRKNGTRVFEYDRGSKGHFTHDSQYALFTISAWQDSVIALKKRKVKKDKLPKDSLGIYHLDRAELTKIGHVKSFKLPKEWSGFIAYQLEDIKEEKETPKDSTDSGDKKKDAPKKVGKKNGYHLVLRNLDTKAQDTIKYVTDYSFAEKGRVLAYTSTGTSKEAPAGAYVMDLETMRTTTLHEAEKASYFQLALSETGEQLGFVVDTDTTKVQLRPNALYLWKKGQSSAKRIMDNAKAPEGHVLSRHGKVHFSEDGEKLFFGLATPPIEKDTSLLEEEIVNVEVWTYNEPRLYTVQEMQLKNDSIRSFATVMDVATERWFPLASAQYPEAELGNEGKGPYALVKTSTPYELASQWTARRNYDFKVVNTSNGETQMTLENVPNMQLSPQGLYGYGYSRVDSTWFTYNLDTGNYKALTKRQPFFNEENDSPNFPYAYGMAGWAKEDGALLLYDRYDIWKFDPDSGTADRLTNGRPAKVVHRYIDLDPEERFIDLGQDMLLSTFDETSKDAGFAELNPRNKRLKTLLTGPYRYGTPKKALLATDLIYTRQSFSEFPDLWVSDTSFKKQDRLSDANPQQKEYNWGTMELVDWISLDGKKLQGMLVKPENFDPNKKYPLLVNFYEKSSDGIHRHRHPKPERSTINYALYASRGYVIFNPDVHYRIGYPGESAYNCVIPGVTSLVEKGFVDKDNIGVQGHSWGGYQIAYLVTRTNIFKAAESGAPVPNMISAYGGIRWWTGLSRQFQYEHTQSRIGGTPWEYPARYIENSPIFNIDKINTPLLIMHNDADGHVPWYQGIEFFTALRRLGKPSWFLNYNGEPHWPLKMQNRVDFSIRMAQFFDHYLKGEPKPVWMEKGVPPLQKGIEQGYELMEGE